MDTERKFEKGERVLFRLEDSVKDWVPVTIEAFHGNGIYSIVFDHSDGLIITSFVYEPELRKMDAL